jgi:hypothetical protein
MARGMHCIEYMLLQNETTITFDESKQGKFQDDYFSQYKIATVPHEPWQHKAYFVPRALHEQVAEIFRDKIRNSAYEPSLSSYCSPWFCMMKKNGKLQIVHNLEPLNWIMIQDAGLPPSPEEFLLDAPGRACYTIFNIFIGYDNRTLHPDS